MDYRSLHRYSRHARRGHYAAVWRTVWLDGGLWLLQRAVPPGLMGLLLVRGDLPDLWRTGWLWMGFLALWELFCFGMRLPVRCAACNLLGERLGMTRRRRCFGTVRAYLRAARIVGAADLLSVLTALPLAAACVIGAVCLRESLVPDASPFWLFGAVQSFAAAVWTEVMRIRIRISLLPVPMLCVHCPDPGAFAILRRSFALMQGSHRTFWGIVLYYLPAVAAVLPVVFVLPALRCDLLLFWHLRDLETRRDAAKGGLLCPI